MEKLAASLLAGLSASLLYLLLRRSASILRRRPQRHQDQRGDLRSARTFAAILACFTLAHALLLLLALQGTLPNPLAALVTLYPVHLRGSLKTLAEGLTYASIRRLQARYRALYAIIGLAMVAALWLEVLLPFPGSPRSTSRSCRSICSKAETGSSSWPSRVRGSSRSARGERVSRAV
jgi:hypothetical protein